MMNFEVWKQRQEEMMREARQNQLAKALRRFRKRHGEHRAPSLTWEIRRLAGRLRNLLKL